MQSQPSQGSVIVVLSVAAAFLALAFLISLRTKARRDSQFITWATIAIVTMVFSGILYLLALSLHMSGAFVVAAALFALAPGFMWASLRSLRGPVAWRIYLVVGIGIAMGIITAFTDETTFTIALLISLLLSSTATVSEGLRMPAPRLHGVVLLMVGAVYYAVVSAVRLVAAVVFGVHSPIFESWFAPGISPVVEPIVLILITIAVVMVVRERRAAASHVPDPAVERLRAAVSAMLEAGESAVWHRVFIRDLKGFDVSLGADYVRAADAALLAVCRRSYPDAACTELTGVGSVVVVFAGVDDPLDLPRLRGRFANESKLVSSMYVPPVEATTVIVDSPSVLQSALELA